MSEGQCTRDEKERTLKALAERNVARARGKRATRQRFKLARDLAAIEKQNGIQFTILELKIASDHWYQFSKQSLDPTETLDSCLAAFVTELTKVRVPTGEGALEKAVASIARLSLSELPVVPGYMEAPETWRRLVALHRELHLANGGNTYFLSYRDAALAIGVSRHQEAYDITATLERVGVIEIVDRGRPGANSHNAAVFRYLLPESENGANQEETAFDI